MDTVKIGVIGVGWIGSQFRRYFEEVKNHKRGENLFLYDSDIKKSFNDDITRADIVFVCLPTPRNPKTGACDISIVEDGVMRAVSNGGGKIIVIKSTVVPGTTEFFQKKYPAHKFLFSPEFLTESRAWEDMMRPDRQIIGFTEKSLDSAHLVLSILPKAPFMSPWGSGTYNPVRITATEAEFIKYASNIHFVRKVNWANSLALSAEKLGVNYENIRKGMSADHRIGDSHLDVNHGGFKGWGGYCLAPSERLFIFNDDHYKIIKAENLNNKAKSVLGWKNGKIIIDSITAMGRRMASELSKFRLSKGRSLTVTSDHIVTVADKEGNLKEKIACEVRANDYFPVVLDGYTADENIKIRLYEEVDLSSQDIYVEKIPQIFADKLKAYISNNQLKGFRRARHTSAPFDACLKAGINIDSQRIKTSISGTWIPAVIKVDEDFGRLIGYYLSEGCVTDNRVLFTFGYHEEDLVDDLKSILNKLSIKFSERINEWNKKPSIRVIKISSRILSAYFKKFGHNCTTKQIPYFIFHSRQSVKDGVLAGLLRGDGSIFKSNQGNYWTINFTTTSQLLAEGVDALLREKGILASIAKVKTAKTRSDNWSLDICEFENVRVLLLLFTKRQAKKVKILGGRKIKSPAYIRVKNLALLPVKAIETIQKITEVVSVETQNHRYITSWGILTHNCFPKDLDAFIQFAKTAELKEIAQILESDKEFNKALLNSQNLSLNEVSHHIDKLEENLNNRKNNHS